jgi:two-component system, OmpR family, KDP operon response regulator KdpE
MTQRLSPSPKVMIVSNQQTTGMLWAYSLQQQRLNVFHETAPARAVEQCSVTNPDLIVLDINASHGTTIRLVKALREETLAPILLLVKRITEEDLLEAYNAGVDDCLFKPLSPSIFLAKVRVWLRHSWSVPPETRDELRAGTFHLLPSQRTLFIGENGEPIHLTNLELRLIHYLMSHPERLASTEELIRAVWGYSEDGDYTTLKNLIYRFRRKVEPNPTEPRFIRTVPGGYIFATDKS